MANKKLFKSEPKASLPKTDAINETGGHAYALSPKAALAQYAATGCLNSTYYASADEQLAQVIELCRKVDADFIARTAIYARERGQMKDLPALLCAILSARDQGLLKAVFPRVIDSGKMLRNFVQIMRSGSVGRKSLGTAPKRMINEWFETRSDEAIFKDSVGQAPSFADIIKMIHPKPKTTSREALFGYFIGRNHRAEELPPLVRQYEQFKAGESLEVPQVPFQMLTSLPLSRKDWAEVARHAGWQMTRMNLNTFLRHGVFEEKGMAELIAGRLRDPQAIARARVFPYQLLIAHRMINSESDSVDGFSRLRTFWENLTGQIKINVPRMIGEALQDAMEVAIGNVPRIDGKVFVFPDVSGSMRSPISGHRQGATTSVQCLDVAALIAAAIIRQNPEAKVIPFSDDVVKVRLDTCDSVMTNTERLANLPSGGTNCSAPLRWLNQRRAFGDLVIYISDNESWIDTPLHGRFGGSATETMSQWEAFKRRNQKARMVCLDLQPSATTQAQERADILNIGGFSDQVFTIIGEFAAGRLNNDHWVGVIESISL